MKKNLAFILFLLVLSCQKDDVGSEYSLPTPEGLIQWDILKVEGENSIGVNDTLKLDVYCPRSSSCDYVSQLLSDEYGNRIFIKAFGNTHQNTPCLMFAVPQVIQYKFVSTQEGIFALEFIKSDEAKIIFKVRVN